MKTFSSGYVEVRVERQNNMPLEHFSYVVLPSKLDIL